MIISVNLDILFTFAVNFIHKKCCFNYNGA